MRWKYSCPHCQSMLNPDETVIVIGRIEGRRVLVGLHPEPGDYRAFLPPDFEVAEGSVWDFGCPVCGADLSTGVAPALCALDMVEDGARHRVYFSRTAGEQATFVISAEGVERFGVHAERHSLEILELV